MPESEPIAQLSHISKTFPGVLALDDVSFSLRQGEVMALLGENGAGKSTLVKIMSGVYTRDTGEFELFGQPVADLSPKRAQELGVAIIHQELNMCAHLTVADNIFLGREETKGGLLANHAMRKQARDILAGLRVDISPDDVVGDLPISKQQMVEIAKALCANARILIMDEPTSALTSREIDDLFVSIRQLRQQGCGIVYISHRLEELHHIVDRITVMRDGKLITSGNFADFTMNEIIAHMVGREITEQFPRVQAPLGKTIFEVKNLNAGRMVQNVTFALKEGEIVGIAGLMGAGRTETTRAIFGIDPKDSGEILLDGCPVHIRRPADAIRAGIVLAPEDRKRDGLCTRLSIRENIALPNLDALGGKTGVIDRKREAAMVRDAQKNLRIKMSGPEADAASLSGGNQQKLVVAKWLARHSRVVIFDEPTRGIDVAAKVEIYNLMNQLKQQGIGVLFVSSELPEVLGIADRILVMCEGRVTGELDPAKTTQAEVLEYATRFSAKRPGMAAGVAG